MFVEHKETGEIAEAPAKVLDDAAKILLKSADFIESHGLSCGGGMDAVGRECVAVVIHTCGIGSDACWQAADRIEAALGDVPFDPYVDTRRLAQWSDSMGAEGRAAEVVAKLREVALS